MKILIVSRYFYPDNQPRAFRTTELANEFSRQGHEVKVIIPQNGRDYKQYMNDHSMVIEDMGIFKWPEIRLKGGKIELLIRRAIRRIFLLLFEYPDIELMFRTKNILRNEGGYDLFISIATPHAVHWGSSWARTKKHRIANTWIADSGDPFMGCRTDSFRKPFYFSFMEKWFCRKADYLSIPFEGAREGYYMEFQDKIRIIPQGFSMKKLRLPEFKKGMDILQFAYSGSIIPGIRDPREFLDFLISEKTQFRFIVYTMDEDLFRPYSEILQNKLLIKAYIPRDQLLVELSKMNFLINFDNNVGVQVPSKLIDYTLTGRPVLNITKELDPVIIRQFLQGDYNGRMHLPAASHYEIGRVSSEFLNLVQVDGM